MNEEIQDLVHSFWLLVDDKDYLTVFISLVTFQSMLLHKFIVEVDEPSGDFKKDLLTLFDKVHAETHLLLEDKVTIQ